MSVTESMVSEDTSEVVDMDDSDTDSEHTSLADLQEEPGQGVEEDICDKVEKMGMAGAADVKVEEAGDEADCDTHPEMEVKVEEDVKEEEDKDSGSLFPDTNIELQHVKGDE